MYRDSQAEGWRTDATVAEAHAVVRERRRLEAEVARLTMEVAVWREIAREAQVWAASPALERTA